MSVPLVELNVGGIVAAVLVTLILLGLLVFGVWFAYSRGYFDSESLFSSAPPCFGVLFGMCHLRVDPGGPDFLTVYFLLLQEPRKGE